MDTGSVNSLPLSVRIIGNKRQYCSCPRAVSYTHLDVYKRQGQDATLGTFVFTAKAQTEEVTGSFTLSDTYCEEEWENGAEKKPSTPCANNGKVDVTIALKTDLAVTAEDKNVTYDGSAQAFNEVTCAAEGATIAYGETEGTYDLTTVPSKTDAGTYTLYYLSLIHI